MGLTQEQLYDLYDGSWEQKFVDRFDKDIFGIRRIHPELAVEELKDSRIEAIVDRVATTIEERDKGNLGIRKEVLALGLTERYLGLRNTLKEMGSSAEKASEEYVKKMLTFAPRELMLLILNINTDSEDRDFKLVLYITELHNRLLEATQDKMDVETLYFAKTLLENKEGGLDVFYQTVKDAIGKLQLIENYVYETRYYNPDNFNMAVVNDIQGDRRWKNVQGFPLNEFVVTGEHSHETNPLYIKYLDSIKPIKKTKALERLWEDEMVASVLDKYPELQGGFDEGKYLYRNGVVVMFRDGLTIVESNGEFRHLPSSKVKNADKEEVARKLM